MFRALEVLRGEDSLEKRAAVFVFDVLAYAVAKCLSTTRSARASVSAEIEVIVESRINRAIEIIGQREIFLEQEHLVHPATFLLFEDAAEQIRHDLRKLGSEESEADAKVRFQEYIVEGAFRVLSRKPTYFSPLTDFLLSSIEAASARTRSWKKYRARLISQFEDEPLFGEDAKGGVTTAQVYQDLRAWWEEEREEGLFDGTSASVPSHERLKRKCHVVMLGEEIRRWLEASDKDDVVRLVSGGPGSGKSTFAKQLAANLAHQPRWRVILVPLQRLRGGGSLANRIDTYFRTQRDEPFDVDTAPIGTIGRDGHKDWIIIFDGLDELAKEGSGSESAAQDFASVFQDMRYAIGDSACVRFVILGRAPSMQDARRRLNLHGYKTLHVADMIPFSSSTSPYGEREFADPYNLCDLDQRDEFWAKWATAKGISVNPPAGMKAEALRDLTKEPLLAYLLIMSEFIGDRWEQAAANRNYIYKAIFEKIWDRERSKPSRVHLNEIGKGGFDALMQALGLAAWRGGGRTGDEATFSLMCESFVRPDLLEKARRLGVADLDNVALLFYTQKDEHGGRGYEFLHKSFGEYLTSCALLSASKRWGRQVAEPQSDFSENEFLRRWLRLTGPTPMTGDILRFLRNEARLEAFEEGQPTPWEIARVWVHQLEPIVNAAILHGIPAHEQAVHWRTAETQARNSEEALLTLLDSCARAAFPSELRWKAESDGGWSPGPVDVEALRSSGFNLGAVLHRLQGLPFSMADGAPFRIDPDFREHYLSSTCLSRLKLDGIQMNGLRHEVLDMEGASLQNASFYGATFFMPNFEGADLRGAELSGAYIFQARFRGADLRGASLNHSKIEEGDFREANLEGVSTKRADLVEMILDGANLRRTTIRRQNKHHPQLDES
ncbi:pentapeptide repeat-containing protein [Parvibaculum sp.]|jgi:hypothetical protein|uniref:pentapeptide repeat-containing protein n=1 Tax=Parvibaculum sp. TaxID=2024848 RepID=UPI002FD930D9